MPMILSRCTRWPTIRPVLKHGPRSFQLQRVNGYTETQRRNESEAGLPVDTRSASLVLVAQCGPVLAACSGAEAELQLRDPKDGELRVHRTKSEETLMEVRRGSNVQIDLQMCSKGRKTNRTI